MTRENCLSLARTMCEDGTFFEILARRVAHPTESQNPDRVEELRAYLTGEIGPYLADLGFTWEVLENPVDARLPFLIAERIESPDLPTVLTYGHGDTVLGMEGRWRKDFDPWKLTRHGDRWFGRGAADNKGQHTINLMAADCVLRERGRLGFNLKVLIEMGEEMGSPGLKEFCEQQKDRLAADVLIASDGPRIDPDTPTLFGGSRGAFNFDLSVNLREGGHHSGNWGGLLSNPGVILANAISCLVDGQGRILVDELKPDGIPDSIRSSLARVQVTGRGGPRIDPEWGEPGLTLAEKVYGWNTLEVLAFECGSPAAPVHAIPPSAWARCHMRYVAGCNPETFIPAVKKQLDKNGFGVVDVTPVRTAFFHATRTDPDSPWVVWSLASVEQTTGKTPTYLPNLGGSLPNEVFMYTLGLPTVWFPHSYAGCSQHAPDEHVLEGLISESLSMMTALFWDLGQRPPL